MLASIFSPLFWSVLVMNSKTIFGIIVLALQLLREVGISAPRLVSLVAERLGLARKTGYESARQIRELLAAQRKDSGLEVDQRELARLRIENQILRYERDHPGVRFAERHGHLPLQARSLCVRLLRDFSSVLSASEIAGTIGVALSSLARWEGKADADCRFPQEHDGRGEHRRTSEEDVQRVLKAWEELAEPMALEGFSEHLNSLDPEAKKLDRKTITRILAANSEHEIEPRSGKAKTESYHPRFEVYYPGAQIAVDAKESKVIFSSAPTEPVKVKNEIAIDIASSAIVGDAVGKEETAEGVERVLIRARKECEKVLSMLSDNGTANRSERVSAVSERETELGQVFSFPRHPWTNGFAEGLFGQFSRIVGEIEIDDSSKEAIAFSIVSIVWRIFIYFHNYSPRRRLSGLSPIEYLRRYAATRDEVDAARRGIQKRRRHSRDLRRPHPRLSDPEFRGLVTRSLERVKLEVDLDEALKALLPFDSTVISNAATALFVAAQRDGFDERKRTFAYFIGIVKNKQKELDADRVRAQLASENTASRGAKVRAEERERARQKEEELEDLERNPERVILRYARRLLIGRLHYMKQPLGDGLRRGLEALERLGRATRSRLDEMAQTIRGWGEFSEELKADMVAMLRREHQRIAGP